MTNLQSRLDRRDHLIAVCLAVATFFALVFTSSEVGVPRDESFYFMAGDRGGDYWLGLVDDPAKHLTRAAVDVGFKYNHEHPVLMKSLFGISHRLLHDRWQIVDDHRLAYRIPSMALWGLASALTFLLARLVASRAVGFVAALAFVFMPRTFFHALLSCFDGPVAALADTRELPRGEIGEMIVRGPVVTQSYDALPAATAAAKISDASGAPRSAAQPSALNAQLGGTAAVWHRMGDCGYLDADGRLWFVGRKVERVETQQGTLHTEPCEQVFRCHPRVTRCALVGLGERGRQRPALIVEAVVKDSAAARLFARELRALALEHAHTTPVKLFYFHPKFPVDVRHNAKIHRLTLAQWAATAKGYESDPKR